jgi:hypothetical protein
MNLKFETPAHCQLKREKVKNETGNEFSLMFIPCIIRRIRSDQQYALICNTLYSMYWLLHV